MLSWVRKKAGSKGFTLVELLLIMVILGVLAAIAIPQFSAYQAKAMNSVALSDAKNVRLFLEAYYDDSHRYP